jgi:hypothetical protein
LRPIQCQCGLTIPSNEINEHSNLHCNDRLVLCPQGCLQTMKFCFVESHIQVQCTIKNVKYQKRVNCPLGCDEILMFRELLEHVTYKCVRRVSECPLFCGNIVALLKLKSFFNLYMLFFLKKNNFNIIIFLIKNSTFKLLSEKNNFLRTRYEMLRKIFLSLVL